MCISRARQHAIRAVDPDLLQEMLETAAAAEAVTARER